MLRVRLSIRVILRVPLTVSLRLATFISRLLPMLMLTRPERPSAGPP